MFDATPSRDRVAAELARLCESDGLRRSPSHARLLRYLVERAVDHDEAALTETAIAIAVFRRDPGAYDPHADPIVRVSVGRLRARLAACYADAGEDRPLRIVVPRGRYSPQFVVTASGSTAPSLLAVRRMRNATGDRGYDDYCGAFARLLAAALASDGHESVVDPVRPTRGARHVPRAALLDPVLSTDGNGNLRLTVRLVDAIDAHVRWTETVAGTVSVCDVLGERVVSRVLVRLRTAVDVLPPD